MAIVAFSNDSESEVRLHLSEQCAFLFPRGYLPSPTGPGRFPEILLIESRLLLVVIPVFSSPKSSPCLQCGRGPGGDSDTHALRHHPAGAARRQDGVLGEADRRGRRTGATLLQDGRRAWPLSLLRLQQVSPSRLLRL